MKSCLEDGKEEKGMERVKKKVLICKKDEGKGTQKGVQRMQRKEKEKDKEQKEITNGTIKVKKKKTQGNEIKEKKRGKLLSLIVVDNENNTLISSECKDNERKSVSLKEKGTEGKIKVSKQKKKKGNEDSKFI